MKKEIVDVSRLRHFFLIPPFLPKS